MSHNLRPACDRRSRLQLARFLIAKRKTHNQNAMGGSNMIQKLEEEEEENEEDGDVRHGQWSANNATLSREGLRF